MAKKSREQSIVSEVQGIEKPMRRSEKGWARHRRLELLFSWDNLTVAGQTLPDCLRSYRPASVTHDLFLKDDFAYIVDDFRVYVLYRDVQASATSLQTP